MGMEYPKQSIAFKKKGVGVGGGWLVSFGRFTVTFLTYSD